MSTDPALTPERIDALNAVDLRLFGVTHGMAKRIGDVIVVQGITDDDFGGLLAATNELTPERGDVLAIEPTGFMRPWAEDLTLAGIVPANIPEVPVADMPAELKEEIAALLEEGRATFFINNLVYAAAHTLLRGVPVYRAEASREEWEALENLLPELGPTDAQKEIGLFYRNTKMLARLGDIAISMAKRSNPPGSDAQSIFLFGSGGAHTPRLGERLAASGVSFTSN